MTDLQSNAIESLVALGIARKRQTTTGATWQASKAHKDMVAFVDASRDVGTCIRRCEAVADELAEMGA